MVRFVEFTTMLPERPGSTVQVHINPDRVDNVQTVFIAGELKDGSGNPLPISCTGITQGAITFVVKMPKDKVLNLLVSGNPDIEEPDGK